MDFQVLIAEPQEVFRLGLCAIFREDPRVSHIYEACSLQELKECVQRYHLDLIVLNQCLVQDYSVLGKNVVILTEEFDLYLLRAAYKSGARGYLSVNVSIDLLRTMLRAMDNEFLVDPVMVPQMMKYFSSPTTLSVCEDLLTPREKEIVHLLQSGQDRYSIARQLCIAETTLKTHIKNIAKKRSQEWLKGNQWEHWKSPLGVRVRNDL